jgi:hypothetical protein
MLENMVVGSLNTAASLTSIQRKDSGRTFNRRGADDDQTRRTAGLANPN